MQYYQILFETNEHIILLRTTFFNSNTKENKRKVLRQVIKIPKEKVKLEKPNTKTPKCVISSTEILEQSY